MAVTLKQIAERTGLSVPTISQILNNKGDRYTPETRDRVLKAVDELGYRPNASARATRTGRFNSVALVLSTESYRSYLPNALLRGIHDGLAEGNVHLTISVLPDREINSNLAPKILREWMCDGLLVDYNVHTPTAMSDLITAAGIPSVWVNVKKKKDAVRPDDFDAGKRAVEHLLSLGHRKIAYVDYLYSADGPLDHYSTIDRQAGVEAGVTAAGLQLRTIRPPHRMNSAEKDAFTREWLARPDAPTAIACYTDSTAIPVLWSAARMGRAIPESLSVITFTETSMTMLGQTLTAMVIPWYDIGVSSARAVLRKIASPETAHACEALTFKLDPGETCAPPG